ncbi:hypothetical protein [Endozoicomonas euniceicola]|uniref:Uncharacterized protein n=1 Tax=Endozoicomonas euniceicola TaxID=1234143 RepID=A0ABY6GX37_9GAMM|nr:hypothetical protein [Endozoicomonas euniceicola]UYM17346.1 hypothetical protein NX720_05325 [Endozoicomonas euniceicola]
MFEPGSSSSSQTGVMHSEYTVLQLTNPLKFQNTTIIPGSRHISARSSKEYGATRYFSGYAFRADSRSPQVIFEQGFMLRLSVKSMHQIVMMTGSGIPGYTGGDGISAAICAQVAAGYCKNENKTEDKVSGCIYLIDGMNMNGFAMPAQSMDYLYSTFPILKKICEVCFPCNILNSSVVGVVWPEGFPAPPSVSPVWPVATTRLNLWVNPRYESMFDRGLAAAKKVVRLFNA